MYGWCDTFVPLIMQPSNKLEHVGGLCKQTVSRFAGGTVLALASLFAVFGNAIPAYAGTTYETQPPLANYLVDFPDSGFGVESTPNYLFTLRLPLGTSFDRIQISVPESQPVMNKGEVFSLGVWSQGWEPWNNINSSVNTRYNGNYDIVVINESKPTPTTYQFIFASTSVVTATNLQDFLFALDPNPLEQDFRFNGSSNGQSASMNGFLYPKTTVIPTMKFCNGSCNNNNFSVIPNLTADAWVRVNSPSTNISVAGGTTQSISVQYNTGTSTAIQSVMRFSSSLQSIVPKVHTVTANGLTSYTENIALPSFNDSISYNVSLETPGNSASLFADTRYRFGTASEYPGHSLTISCNYVLQFTACVDVLAQLPLNTLITVTSPDMFQSPFSFRIIAIGSQSFGDDPVTVYLTDSVQNFNLITPRNSNTVFSYSVPTVVHAVSPTYRLNVTTETPGLFQPPPEAQSTSCDQTSGLSWAICSTVAFLFVPTQSSVDSFMNNYASLQTKIPFVYAYQSTNLFTSMYNGTPGVVPTVSVTTGIGTITFISQAQILAIPFVGTLRTLIAVGLWIMLFIVLYRKTLTIHDKVTV